MTTRAQRPDVDAALGPEALQSNLGNAEQGDDLVRLQREVASTVRPIPGGHALLMRIATGSHRQAP